MAPICHQAVIWIHAVSAFNRPLVKIINRKPRLQYSTFTTKHNKHQPRIYAGIRMNIALKHIGTNGEFIWLCFLPSQSRICCWQIRLTFTGYLLAWFIYSGCKNLLYSQLSKGFNRNINVPQLNNHSLLRNKIYPIGSHALYSVSIIIKMVILSFSINQSLHWQISSSGTQIKSVKLRYRKLP